MLSCICHFSKQRFFFKIQFVICVTCSNSVVGPVPEILGCDSVDLVGVTLSSPVMSKKGLIDFCFSNSLIWRTDFINNETINK